MVAEVVVRFFPRRGIGRAGDNIGPGSARGSEECGHGFDRSLGASASAIAHAGLAAVVLLEEDAWTNRRSAARLGLRLEERLRLMVDACSVRVLDVMRSQAWGNGQRRRGRRSRGHAPSGHCTCEVPTSSTSIEQMRAGFVRCTMSSPRSEAGACGASSALSGSEGTRRKRADSLSRTWTWLFLLECGFGIGGRGKAESAGVIGAPCRAVTVIAEESQISLDRHDPLPERCAI